MLGRNTSKLLAKPGAAAAPDHGLRTGSPSLSELCHCRMLSLLGTMGLQFCSKWVISHTNLEGHDVCLACWFAYPEAVKGTFTTLLSTWWRSNKLQRRGARKTLDGLAVILIQQAIGKSTGTNQNSACTSDIKGIFCSAPAPSCLTPSHAHKSQLRKKMKWCDSVGALVDYPLLFCSWKLSIIQHAQMTANQETQHKRKAKDIFSNKTDVSNNSSNKRRLCISTAG